MNLTSKCGHTDIFWNVYFHFVYKPYAVGHFDPGAFMCIDICTDQQKKTSVFDVFCFDCFWLHFYNYIWVKRSFPKLLLLRVRAADL